MNKTIQAAKKIDDSNRGQSSQALLIQCYCNSILEQSKVNFSGFKGETNGDKLVAIGDKINTALTNAQSHANDYLDNIQPAIITNISNIKNYYALHQAVATTLPPGSTKTQWLDSLKALNGQSQAYEAAADGVVAKITSLHNNLTSDSATFTGLVSELNGLVNGDNGILASINDQIGTIQSKIDGAIAGICVSGLAIVGGVFIAAVGGIADFVTAGASTPVLVGGIALVAAGVGGEAASALTLKALNDQKGNLLTQKAQLTSAVKLATGTSQAYQSFNDQVKTAVTAATNMKSAWSFLSSDLGNLVKDIKNGTKDTGTLRTIFLTAANSTIQTINTDITTIQHQMTGVQSHVAPAGTTVGTEIVNLANQHAA